MMNREPTWPERLMLWGAVMFLIFTVLWMGDAFK